MAILNAFSRPAVAAAAVISLGCSSPDERIGTNGGGGQGGGGPAAPYSFRAGMSGFELSVEGGLFRPFWPIGINYGHGIPGTFPGEFLASREQIREFIQAMADLGTNSVRVYTVQSPLFYEELRSYNEAHPDKPMFLLQGAWLPEPAESPTFDGQADYQSPWVESWFADELEKAVDVVHGNREILVGSPENPQGYGRSFGTFTADVSPWLLGWLVGREVEPFSIQGTHEAYYAKYCGGQPCTVEYAGEHFSISNATPIEGFVTRALDRIATYEASRYGQQHCVAFSSWPTLDPIDHLVESDAAVDDMEALDLRKVEVSPKFEPGLFFSYHVYPYYPEFILYEPAYQIDDELGPNSYLGYLKKLRTEYAGRTLLIGEIGLPSSQGSAHFAKSGLTHGGLDEVEQGNATLRALRSITGAEMNGAFLFELIDEWWKRSWVVERIELPVERRHLWYNAISPEQNFGFIAIRPGLDGQHHVLDGIGDDFPQTPNATQNAAVLAPLDAHDPMRTLRSLTIDSDEGFLHLLLEVESLDPDGNGQVDWDKTDYLLGIDTLAPDRGDKCLEPSCSISAERRVEFLLRINAEDDVTLSVDKPYDLAGVWHGYREPWQLYRTEANEDGLFNIVRHITNDEFSFGGQLISPIIYQETGRFRTGPEKASSNSNLWYSREGGTIEIRIPWMLLNFADPSNRMLVDDFVPGKKNATIELQASQTSEIAVVVAALGGTGEQETTVVDTLPRASKMGGTWVIPASGAPTFTWATWDANPTYHMYRKRSFDIVQQALPGIVPQHGGVLP